MKRGRTTLDVRNRPVDKLPKSIQVALRFVAGSGVAILFCVLFAGSALPPALRLPGLLLALIAILYVAYRAMRQMRQKRLPASLAQEPGMQRAIRLADLPRVPPRSHFGLRCPAGRAQGRA